LCSVAGTTENAEAENSGETTQEWKTRQQNARFRACVLPVQTPVAYFGAPTHDRMMTFQDFINRAVVASYTGTFRCDRAFAETQWRS